MNFEANRSCLHSPGCTWVCSSCMHCPACASGRSCSSLPFWIAACQTWRTGERWRSPSNEEEDCRGDKKYSIFISFGTMGKILCYSGMLEFRLFLLFTKPHFQTLNALKSTSFQAFQIILYFFRLLLTDAFTPLVITNCSPYWFFFLCFSSEGGECLNP